MLYDDGPLWAWLDQRGLARPAGRAPLTSRVVMRVDGRTRRMPPTAVLRGLLRLRRMAAPVDVSFIDWAASQLDDPDVADRIANFFGVVTFDHDPGRLSAAFVNERLQRVLQFPPPARYIPGGWATLVARLAQRARDLGVQISTGTKVDIVPPAPVILALPLSRARELVGDRSIAWTGTRTALLDVGIARRRRDPFVISDLDAPGWAEAYTVPDPSLAPKGHHLVQAQAGLRFGESLDDGVARLEELLDVGYDGWRQRETWRRRMAVTDESGALDLPGTTWRDRPAVTRGDGVYLVGDMVAAPGILSEVSFNSAVEAVSHLLSSPRLVRVA
ncbi:MAG: FAD-dependent oxidoreductase [Acidimicrobiia bacterium]|nr:FAD-dependent oxidoreductase [Acidimicrobiia bacterium]